MKLTGKKKFGYALGIFTESLLYNMYYTYFLTFLIEIVKVKPSYASIVIFISIAWDAITDPIIGNYADRPGVDKKKMMKYSVLPLAVFFIVAWTTIGAGFTTQIAKILTYTFISLLIWIFYTTYSIPYYAIVPELTEDYDERTKIRSLSSILNAICVGLGNILPALVPTVAIIVGEKLQSNAYAFVAAIISILAIICGFVCCKSLNGVYTPKGEKQKAKMPGVKETFKSYGEIIKLKPAKWFFVFVFFFLAASSMIQSNLTYMVIDCIGMEYDTGIAIVIVCLVVFMAATAAIAEKVAEKTDRRTTTLIFMTFVIIGEFITKFIGLDAQIGNFKVMCVVCPALLGIAVGTFWTFFYSMGYDLVELDEFKNGVRRESTITAIPQLIQKFGSAFGILIAGQLLTAYGYDSSSDIAGNEALFAKITDQHIIDGMENISTIIPAALLVVSFIGCLLYPMTRKNINNLMEQLNKKRNGVEYSTDGLEKLI